MDSATDPESNLIHHQLSLFSRSRIRRVSVRIGTVSESLRGRSCKDSLPSKACLAVALFLGFVPTTSMFVVGRLLPGQWVSQNGMTYLSSLGIASMLLMVLIPYLTLATLLEQMAQIQNKEAEAIKKLEPQIPDVKAVFGQDEPVVALSGHLRVCRICARAVLNIFLFSYSLADLPARNPREPLNQTKHVLAWLEFFGIWAITALFLLKPAVVEIARFLELPVFALFRAHLIRALANFSALALLRMANPQVCLDRIARASKSGAAVLLAEVVSSLFGASLGVAALVSKISTTAFIADTLFWDWEMIQWLTLVGLLNNLAGLIQIEELRLESWQTNCHNVSSLDTVDMGNWEQ